MIYIIYNTVSGSFIAKNISDSGEIKLPPGGSAVVVCIPSGGKMSYEKNKMWVNGVAVDYMRQEKK